MAEVSPLRIKLQNCPLPQAIHPQPQPTVQLRLKSRPSQKKKTESSPLDFYPPSEGTKNIFSNFELTLREEGDQTRNGLAAQFPTTIQEVRETDPVGTAKKEFDSLLKDSGYFSKLNRVVHKPHPDTIATVEAQKRIDPNFREKLQGIKKSLYPPMMASPREPKPEVEPIQLKNQREILTDLKDRADRYYYERIKDQRKKAEAIKYNMEKGRQMETAPTARDSEDEERKPMNAVAMVMYKIAGQVKKEENDKDDLHTLKLLNARSSIEAEPPKLASSKCVRKMVIQNLKNLQINRQKQSLQADREHREEIIRTLRPEARIQSILRPDSSLNHRRSPIPRILTQSTEKKGPPNYQSLRGKSSNKKSVQFEDEVPPVVHPQRSAAVLPSAAAEEVAPMHRHPPSNCAPLRSKSPTSSGYRMFASLDRASDRLNDPMYPELNSQFNTLTSNKVHPNQASTSALRTKDGDPKRASRKNLRQEPFVQPRFVVPCANREASLPSKHSQDSADPVDPHTFRVVLTGSREKERAGFPNSDLHDDSDVGQNYQRWRQPYRSTYHPPEQPAQERAGEYGRDFGESYERKMTRLEMKRNTAGLGKRGKRLTSKWKENSEAMGPLYALQCESIRRKRRDGKLIGNRFHIRTRRCHACCSKSKSRE